MFAAALCALVATAAHAQVTRPITFGIAGGVSIPRNTFMEEVDKGFNVTAFGELKFANTPYGVRIEAGWNQFDTKPYIVHSKTLSASNISGNLTREIQLTKFARGYAIGGAGYYRVQTLTGTIQTFPASTAGVPAGQPVAFDSAVVVISRGKALNKLGANIGGGVRVPLGKVEPYVEVRVNRVAGRDGIRFIPVTFGLRF